MDENKQKQIKQLIEKEQRTTDPVNLIIDKQDEILEKVDGIDIKAKELDANPAPISDFINDFVNTLTKGEKGDKGDKGDQGEPGKDGETPDINLIATKAAFEAKPVKGVDYFDGKDGADGRDGKDGKDGLPGKDGRNGIDGRDGQDAKSVDPKEIIKSLKGKLDITDLRNSQQLTAAIGKIGGLHGGGIVTIQSAGIQVTNKATVLNFAGTGINSVTNLNGVVTIDVSGGSGTVTSVTGTANRITSTGGTTPVIDISASYVGQSSITTLGTITTGVWNGTNISLAKGGTGVSLVDPGANTLMGWDDTDNAVAFLTIGSGLSYDHATHTLSASAGGGTVTNVASADGSITVTNPNTTVDLAVVKSPKLTTARTIGGVSFDGTANITVATATGGFTVSGGNLALGTNSITMSGSIGVTGTRVTKLWATDVESTNMYTVGGTSLSSTFSPIAGSASIVTVGTIATGTWQGTVIGSTYGGTGINNGGRTLTLNTNSGTLAFSAASKTLTIAKSITLDGTDSTTMTFPSTNATIARTDAGQTFTGTQVLAENASIQLDPAGSADGKYTGITVTATAGYTQAFGDLVYLDPTDSRWEAVDANSAAGADGDARGIIGMVVSAGTDGNACTILLQGIIRADAKFPTFTVNNPIYVSETAGAVTQTQPTTTDVVIRVVGFALTADEVYFNPDGAYITHT